MPEVSLSHELELLLVNDFLIHEITAHLNILEQIIARLFLGHLHYQVPFDLIRMLIDYHFPLLTLLGHDDLGLLVLWWGLIVLDESNLRHT